jgi:hypothetical protein
MLRFGENHTFETQNEVVFKTPPFVSMIDNWREFHPIQMKK